MTSLGRNLRMDIGNAEPQTKGLSREIALFESAVRNKQHHQFFIITASVGRSRIPTETMLLMSAVGVWALKVAISHLAHVGVEVGGENSL